MANRVDAMEMTKKAPARKPQGVNTYRSHAMTNQSVQRLHTLRSHMHAEWLSIGRMDGLRGSCLRL